MTEATRYPFKNRYLPPADGGGWLATFPDLPGCMGDGETPAAIEDGFYAAAAWLQVAQESGDPIPEPGAGGESERFMARAPKSLHTRLSARAAQEWVSMNTLVVSLLAEGAGERAHHA
jgi:antitoxin HicB